MIPRRTLNCIRKPIAKDHGRVIESDGTPFTIVASVQPLKPADLQLLPEARRQNKARKLFTNDTLYCFGNSAFNPDQVTIDGELFEVIAEDSWKNGIINYNMYIVSHLTAATV